MQRRFLHRGSPPHPSRTPSELSSSARTSPVATEQPPLPAHAPPPGQRSARPRTRPRAGSRPRPSPPHRPRGAAPRRSRGPPPVESPTAAAARARQPPHRLSGNPRPLTARPAPVPSSSRSNRPTPPARAQLPHTHPAVTRRRTGSSAPARPFIETDCPRAGGGAEPLIDSWDARGRGGSLLGT